MPGTRCRTWCQTHNSLGSKPASLSKPGPATIDATKLMVAHNCASRSHRRDLTRPALQAFLNWGNLAQARARTQQATEETGPLTKAVG